MISTEDKAFWIRPLPDTIPDNLKPLRDKHGPCAGCGSHPSHGHTLRTCAACKTILYCSRECQKADWAAHRERCNTAQALRGRPTELEAYAEELAALSDPSWPRELGSMERAVMLSTCIELHRTNIYVSIMLLRHALQRRGRDLDGRKHKLEFDFGYRTESDGNPASWLFLRKLAIVDRTFEESGSEDEDEEGHEAYERNQLCLVFGGGGMHVDRWLPLSAVDPQDPEVAAWIDDFFLDWVQNLRLAMTVGMIFESTDRSGGFPNACVMRRDGKVWKRTKMVGLDLVVRLLENPIGSQPEVVTGSLSSALGLGQD